MKKENLSVVCDIPIKNEAQDSLGYNNIYANSLFNILESNDKNIALGIFGSYGSGKSSIINLLEKKYSHKPKVKFIKSSIWGHSPRNTLKQILLDLSQDFEDNSKKKLKRDLFDQRENIDKTILKTHVQRISIITICFLIGLSITLPFISQNLLSPYTTLMGNLFMGLIMILLSYYGIETISKKISKPPMHLSNFEMILNRVLKTLEKNEIKEIIIAIDDLDRNYNDSEIIKILDKLSILKKYNYNITIKTLLPFSLVEYINNINEDKSRIINNINKFLDSFIFLDSLDNLELFRLNQQNG